MLVEPPVTEILKKVDDRYSLIIMTSKRARPSALLPMPLVPYIGHMSRRQPDINIVYIIPDMHLEVVFLKENRRR